ncbi:MAG TPA: DUF2155 domain-containing protein [Nitrospirota bacterium]|nr:DUF2155 domain-containing protein [Nitrospirota bacterium]
MKKVLAAVLVIGLACSLAACKKKEEKPQLPAGHPSMEGAMPQAGSMPKVDRKVVVPKNISAKWTAVKLVVEDKAAKKSKEYTVNVGSELAIPDTKLKVKVLAFLPHFMMTDKEITSTSDKPTMPAAQIEVAESGKETWKGWIFSLQPDMHPYVNDKIAIKLGGGVSK